MALGGQEHLNVLAGSIENAGQVSGCHDCDCWTRKRRSSRRSQFVVGRISKFTKQVLSLELQIILHCQSKKVWVNPKSRAPLRP